MLPAGARRNIDLSLAAMHWLNTKGLRTCAQVLKPRSQQTQRPVDSFEHVRATCSRGEYTRCTYSCKQSLLISIERRVSHLSSTLEQLTTAIAPHAYSVWGLQASTQAAACNLSACFHERVEACARIFTTLSDCICARALRGQSHCLDGLLIFLSAVVWLPAADESPRCV